MSQFETPYGEQYPAQPQPARTSGLAVWSLVCSLVFCCPVTTILGVLLGIGAVVSIGKNPARKGKGLAFAGIVLGLLFTALQAWAGNYLYRLFAEMMETMMNKAPEAVMAGASGDYAAFKGEFMGAGATAPDSEVQAFFDELSRRYGALQSCRFDESRQVPPQFGQPRVTMPYLLEFDSGTVNAEIEIVVVDQATGEMLFDLGHFEVIDPDQGNLRYPPAGTSAPASGGTSGEPEPDPSGQP